MIDDSPTTALFAAGRYPSYGAHDPDSGYPGPGVLQASSPLAQASFATWSFYDDLTFLRIHDVVADEIARERLPLLR